MDDEVSGEAARAQGFAYLVSPDELGLPTLGDDGIASALREVPREHAVAVFSRTALILHAFGEVDPTVQRTWVQERLDGHARERALAFLGRHPNAVVFSYEASVRLALLAIAHGLPEGPALTRAEEDQLLALLPEVQTRLSRVDRDDDITRGTVESFEDAALTLFLGANSAGQLQPDRNMLNAVALGGFSIQAMARHLSPRNSRLVDDAMVDAVGGTLTELHAAAMHLANFFVFGPRQATAGRKFSQIADTRELRRAGDRLGALCARAVEVASVQPGAVRLTIGNPWCPRACFPTDVVWHPFHRSSGNPHVHALWDVRMLHAMVGAMFPEWVRLALGNGRTFDVFSSAWDLAVEDALDEMVRPLIPSWARPELPGMNCDRVFAVGHDLFLAEIKNVRPSARFLADPTVEGLRKWLTGAFFSEKGFPQIHATLRSLVAQDARVRGRRVRKFRAFWPIVVSWTRAPGHTVFTDLLQRIQAEVGEPDVGLLQGRLRHPLIVDYDEFLLIASLVPVLEAAGLSLGDALEAYFGERVDRPFTFGTFLGNLLPPHRMPVEVSDAMRRALQPAREIGDRLRAEPS